MTPEEKENNRRTEIIDAVLDEVEDDATREIKYLLKRMDNLNNTIECLEKDIVHIKIRIEEFNYLVERLESLIVLDYDAGQYGELL